MAAPGHGVWAMGRIGPKWGGAIGRNHQNVRRETASTANSGRQLATAAGRNGWQLGTSSLPGVGGGWCTAPSLTGRRRQGGAGRANAAGVGQEARGHLLRDPLEAGRGSLFMLLLALSFGDPGVPRLRITAPRTPLVLGRVTG